ncbi:MAG: PilZ domain-containing protein [Pseudomonadota bacterium]|nr:PilZ domain-containing protein [Pseudomonadota bacterium]
MTTRKKARFKVPINIFLNGEHYPIVDLSTGGAGVIYEGDPPEMGAELETQIVFPHKTGNEGWMIDSTVVRIDEDKHQMGLEFGEDAEFKEFLLEFLAHMRDQKVI